MIGSLKIFDQIAVMTDGGPGFETETLTYIIYKVGFGELRQGFGTALAQVLFLLILIVTIIQVKFLRKREVQL
jgi:ABC-type sugar transport system permease subunit